MAKKKVSAMAAAPAERNPKSAPRDLSPENRMESLKTLNQLLLKETVEKRGQIEQLQSQIEELAFDGSFLSGLEGEVSRLVLSSGLSEERLRLGRRVEEEAKAVQAVAEEEVRSLLVEAEEKVRALQGRVDLAAEMLSSVEGRLGRVMGEKDDIKKALDLAVSERDLRRRDLVLKEREIRDLKVKVFELEMANSEIRAGLENIKVERDDLERQGRKREEDLWSLNQEKVSLERLLGECRQSIGNLERKIVEMGRNHHEELELLVAEKEESAAKVSALEKERRSLEEIKRSLEGEICNLEDTINLLKQEEEALRMKVVEMEDRNVLVQDELKRAEVKIGLLEKEKEEKERSFESQTREATQQLDDLRGRMGVIAGEKDKIEQARADQEVEIAGLQSKVLELHSKVSELQDLCRDQLEMNTQLEAKLNVVNSQLDLQTEEAAGLRLQVEELKKEKYGILEEFRQHRVSFDELVSENEEGKRHLNALAEDKASLERSLLDAQGGIEEMEGKMKSAEMISRKGLSLLRSTSEALSGSEKGQENGAVIEIEMQPFAEELESIKLAFRSKVGEIEDKNQEIEHLKSVMADAERKKGGLWMWLYPATTTVVAAISFAYAARGR